jgi:hypothetical protein
VTPEEIVRKAIGTYPIFENSLAWMAMVRAVKMGQREAYEDAARICDECRDQHWGPLMAAAIRARTSECKHAWHPDQETGAYSCIKCGTSEELPARDREVGRWDSWTRAPK